MNGRTVTVRNGPFESSRSGKNRGTITSNSGKLNSRGSSNFQSQMKEGQLRVVGR